MQLRFFLLLPNIIFFLSACSLFSSTRLWSDELPSRQFFVSYYQESIDNHQYQAREDYLNWVSTFYQGTSFSPGWLQLMEELLLEVDADERTEYELKMQSLGRQIAAEWAQDNQVRLIDTRCASIWRDALIEAIERDDLENYFRHFEDDVNAILLGQLHRDEIVLSRYYEVEEFDFI